jgi:hypothetical protein
LPAACASVTGFPLFTVTRRSLRRRRN